MAQHILNVAFSILNISFPCYWLVIPLLVSYWLARQAPMRIHNGGGLSCHLPSAIRIMNMARQSHMSIHDVSCICAYTYPHHEGAQLIAKYFHEKIAAYRRYHECGMLNLECFN
jgi:hypothetical protein